ncbi:DMT family transporter [Candidatus Woesearchaeota archaeon]|nr:DMT family transporter [Candidatus Woesearchaeota archaeon]
MKNKPVLLVLIASLGFSFNPVITKILSDEISINGILFLRFLLVTILFPLVAIPLSGHTLKSFFAIKPKQLMVFFLLSFLLVANMLLFFNAFYFINVNRALFIHLMYPVVAIILAHIFIKEPVTKQDLIAASVSFLGIVAIFWNTSLKGGKILGDIMVILSLILWCSYMVFNRYTSLREIHYRQTFWLFLFGTLLLFPSYLLFGIGQPISNISMNGIFLILIIVIFSTLIPYSILSYVSRHIKTSTTGLLLLLSQVISISLSFIILKETPAANVIIGGVLIIFSAVISIYSFDKLFSFRKYLKAKNLYRGFVKAIDIIYRKFVYRK